MIAAKLAAILWVGPELAMAKTTVSPMVSALVSSDGCDVDSCCMHPP
jgi:hypothetical protein